VYGSWEFSNIHLTIFKNSVRTSKRTPYFTITKIILLMLFKGIIVVYSENHTKTINTKYNVAVFKVAGAYH
jgi:hypothetical protein